jgi:hypothetical protein
MDKQQLKCDKDETYKNCLEKFMLYLRQSSLSNVIKEKYISKLYLDMIDIKSKGKNIEELTGEIFDFIYSEISGNIDENYYKIQMNSLMNEFNTNEENFNFLKFTQSQSQSQNHDSKTESEEDLDSTFKSIDLKTTLHEINSKIDDKYRQRQELKEINYFDLEIFTKEDFKVLNNEFNRDKYKIIDLIRYKTQNIQNIRSFCDFYSNNNGLTLTPINNYKKVIVMSDIHADLLVFVSTLIKSNIMRFIDDHGNVVPFNIDDINENYRTYNVLEEYLQDYSFEFNHRDTILYILGDIVDGSRQCLQKEKIVTCNVQNITGLNEILIHLILWNLRLSAIKNRSYVKIIIGNHDLDLLTIPNLAKGYLDQNTKNFYENDIVNGNDDDIFALRRKVLSPFYLIDACVFDVIVNFENRNIISVLSHGSFSAEDIFNIDKQDNWIDVLIYKKTEIKDFIFDSYLSNNLERISVSSYLGKNSVPKENTKKFNNIDPMTLIADICWSRLFFSNIYTRNNIEYISESCTFIMGHCVTHGINFDNSIGYDDCSSKNKRNTELKECVVAKLNKNYYPKVIFVDNAVSYALMNFKIENRLPKMVEILVIINEQISVNYYTLRINLHENMGKHTIYKNLEGTDDIKFNRILHTKKL